MRLTLATSLAGPTEHGVLTAHTPPIRVCTNPTLQLFNTIYLSYKAKAGK